MPAKNNGMSELPYEKPVERGRWEAIRLGIYNPSTNEVLGRTCKSWGGLLIFYTIFYAVLAAFFAICMKGMLHTIDTKTPYFTQDYSLIGSSPGMGFRPISPDVEKDGSLIWYQAKNESNVKTWTDRVDKFLEPYFDKTKLKGEGRNHVACDFDSPNNNKKPGEVCAIYMENWGKCQQKFGYSYNMSSPCIFVKLNKIFGWIPEYYNGTDFPNDMPLALQRQISNTPISRRNNIWVTCEGENPADKENVGPIEVFPKDGIPGYHFPYENQDGYLSPMVAIRFIRPKMNVLINIECRAWAKNINYRRHSTLREGSVHFELMID